MLCVLYFFFFKQKTAYEMRISDWSSDVCSSDLRIVEPCDPTGENLVLDDALAAKAGTDFEKVERLEIEIVGDLGIRRRGQPRALGGRGIDGAIGEIGRASCRERGCQYV